MTEKLVEIKDLEISFGEGSKKFVAVKNANFFINKGETFSLVGESGSGKTTIGRAIIGLNDTSAGDIFYEPKHPYTWSLLSSLPQLADANGALYSIPGTPPSLY